MLNTVKLQKEKVNKLNIQRLKLILKVFKRKFEIHPYW